MHPRQGRRWSPGNTPHHHTPSQHKLLYSYSLSLYRVHSPCVNLHGFCWASTCSHKQRTHQTPHAASVMCRLLAQDSIKMTAPSLPHALCCVKCWHSTPSRYGRRLWHPPSPAAPLRHAQRGRCGLCTMHGPYVISHAMPQPCLPHAPCLSEPPAFVLCMYSCLNTPCLCQAGA
jgi:hypothetical protein